MSFIPVTHKAEFSAAITPVSHDLSEISLTCWFGAQETWLIIINAEDNCAA